MKSNRYPEMVPIRVNAAAAYLPDYVTCPTCGGSVKLNDNEIGYHGWNGGAHLCEGSGILVGEIVTPITIISTTEVN